MAKSLKELYTFTGDTGPTREQAKKTMGWLLSPAAQGLGEKLLRDAYSKTGRPVTICISHTEPSHYANGNAEHTIILNPSDNANHQIMAADGSWHGQSLEAGLAHELTHAGQDIADRKKWVAVYDKLEKTLPHTPEIFERLQTLEDAKTFATNTPYSILAQQYLQQHIGESLAFGNEMLGVQQQHPDYIAYITKYENPAIANENKVQRLRGEPVRLDYKGYRPVAGYDEHNAMEQHASLLNGKVGIAPYAPTPVAEGYWQDKIQNPKDLSFKTPDHPLLAAHQDGGRD